jgi:putative ABC transport system permease protein
MESLARQLRQASRQLAASPGFTLTTVVTLSLAIGATTAIFSAVYAVLLSPMAVREPDAVVIGWGRDPARTEGVVELSYLDVADLGRASRHLASTAAVGSHAWSAVLDEAGEPTRLSTAGVSGSFFETLGAPPLLGRVLLPADDVPNAESVAVMSHGLWVRRFGSDPAVVGRTIQLDDEPTRIVGVMPAAFDYPRGVELWAPLAPGLSAAAATWKTDVLRNVGVLYLVGRLRAGATATVASEELSGIARRLEAGGVTRIGEQVELQPFLDHVIGPTRPALWALFGAVAVLLGIACANVSGLMLTRVAVRQRDRAVRRALGASGRVLAAEWIAETLVLAIAGGVAGLLIAQWLAGAIVALAPEGIPRLDQVAISVPVALFSGVVMTLVTLLCGLAPAREAGVLDEVEALKEDGRSSTSSRTLRARSGLLVVQIGLAVLLMVGAGLILRSFAGMRQIDLGFDPARVLSVQVDPRIEPERQNAWVDDLLSRLAIHPEVEAAGAVYLRPLALGPIGQGTQVVLEGQPDTPEIAARNPLLNYQVATPDYFRAMRTPLKRGRVFTAEDRATAPRVAIVSESTASRLWPGQDPIGRRFLTSTFERGTGRRAWRTVIGVVSDVRYRGLGELQLDMYDPAPQTPLAATDLMIRTSADPLALAGVVQAEARAMAPDVIITGITTMDAVVGQAMAPWRFASWVLALFAALALLLATVGLVSVVSLDVAHRQREFAIRLALGAPPGEVVSRVLRGTLARVTLGAMLGLIAAGVLTRTLGALLVGVPPLHWPIYGAVLLVVVLAALIAAWAPVRWAARIDPIAILRR